VAEYDEVSSTTISFDMGPTSSTTVSISNTAPETDSFNFVVVGDNRDGPETFTTILEEINADSYAFCINTGDIISSGQREQFQEFMDMVDDLAIPLYVSIGNHELYNNSPDHAMEFLGEVTYSFEYGNTLFVILDDSDYIISEEEYDWMDDVMSSTTKENIIVSAHIPPYDPREGESHCLKEADALRFEDFMADHDVDLVLAGHIHMYDHTVIKGVDYVVTAGAGAPLYADEEEGGFFHYTVVSVNGQDITHEVVKVTSPLYTMERATERLTEAEEMYNSTQEDLQKTWQLCTTLEDEGKDMTAYFSTLENAEETLTDAQNNIELAHSKYSNEYYRETYTAANAAHSYALQANVMIDSVYEEALEISMEEEGFPMAYVALVIVAVVIVGALAVAMLRRRNG
jgi:predicted phosphodiesterase